MTSPAQISMVHISALGISKSWMVIEEDFLLLLSFESKRAKGVSHDGVGV